ncbi:MAG TPA: tol-pal system protein YbgF [Candidatus Hydrogenedentes bacterium]|nr:tol-pal system protein YbgF [Candidatus Hydrogenedentota bacterium]
MHSRPLTWASAALALMVLAGCNTLGVSKQVRNTVYDTNKRVRTLDENLGGSVTKLTETSATLMQRVNESDEQMRQLRSMLEENQTRVESLSKDIADLKSTLYRRMGLSTAPGSNPLEPQVGGVIIERSGSQPIASDLGSPPMGGTPATTPPGAPVAATPATAPTPATPEETKMFQDALAPYRAYNYAEALTKLDAFLQKYPNSELAGSAQFWKAACYLYLQKNQEAIQESEKVVNNYPTNSKVPLAMRNKAVALHRLGQTDQATKLLQEIIATYPATPAAKQAQDDLEKIKGLSSPQ